jgi:uncharacterized protein
MILQFTTENYKSFFAPATLNLVAAKLSKKKAPTILDSENIFNASGFDLLRSAAIYGANASGKSNLISAVGFMRKFVLTSARDSQAGDKIDIESFKLRDNNINSSLFEVVFLMEEKRYRYGFRVNPDFVTDEWLYYVPQKKETCLFERTNGKFYISNIFKEGSEIEGKTSDNALFMSVCAQFNGDISKKIIDWFKKLYVLQGSNEQMYTLMSQETINNPEIKNKVLLFLKAFDIDILDIQLEKMDHTGKLKEIYEIFSEKMKENLRANGQDSVMTLHNKFDSVGNIVGSEKFSMQSHESEGTKKLFAFSFRIIDALDSGKTVFIDELDAKLHPIITKKIIGLFNSSKTNPKGAQLIMTTHDTNLLDSNIFRRDQIWFAEKDRFSSTDLYSLYDFKVNDRRIREDESYQKNYVIGKYGAIPYIGVFDFIDE